jgi:hypothetical protein
MENQSASPKQQAALRPEDVPVTNPSNLNAVYANHMGVSATMTDFTIYFLEVGQIPGPAGNIPKQEIKAIVTLPIMAATGLSDVLQQVLKTHTEKLAEMQKKMSSGQ